MGYNFTQNTEMYTENCLFLSVAIEPAKMFQKYCSAVAVLPIKYSYLRLKCYWQHWS